MTLRKAIDIFAENSTDEEIDDAIDSLVEMIAENVYSSIEDGIGIAREASIEDGLDDVRRIHDLNLVEMIRNKVVSKMEES